MASLRTGALRSFARLPLLSFSFGLLVAGAALAACSASGDADDDGTAPVTSSSAGTGSAAGGAGGEGGMTSSSSGLGGNFGAGGGQNVPLSDVEVVITADNAYGFGYGDGNSMVNYFGGVEATLAGHIFNCNGGAETYLVPAEDAAAGNYLYIVAYADKSTTQGVLGQFRRVEDDTNGATVYTGTADWEVCATGQDYSPGSGGPDLAAINAAIPNCVWYDSTGDANGMMQIGEDNTTPRDQVVIGNEFPIACGIDGEAKWMWFNWSPASLDWPNTGSPFIWPGGGGNPDQQFLIFRLGAEVVPPIVE